MLRLKGWIEDHPVVVAAAIVVLLITTFGDLAGYGRDAYGVYEDRFRWREREYAVIAKLQSDQTVERFEETLGAPLFRRVSRDTRWLELAWERRGYWVHALTRRRGDARTIGFYAVTVCDESLKVPIEVPGFGTLPLMDTTLADMDVPLYNRIGVGLDRVHYRYIIPASSPANVMEYTLGPHYMNFKNYAWGLNAVCGAQRSLPQTAYEQLIRVPRRPKPDPLREQLPPNLRRPIIPDPTLDQLTRRQLEARARVTINTFGEWGPGESIHWPTVTPIGVDEGFVFNR